MEKQKENLTDSTAMELSPVLSIVETGGCSRADIYWNTAIAIFERDEKFICNELIRWQPINNFEEFMLFKPESNAWDVWFNTCNLSNGYRENDDEYYEDDFKMECRIMCMLIAYEMCNG